LISPLSPYTSSEGNGRHPRGRSLPHKASPARAIQRQTLPWKRYSCHGVIASAAAWGSFGPRFSPPRPAYKKLSSSTLVLIGAPFFFPIGIKSVQTDRIRTAPTEYAPPTSEPFFPARPQLQSRRPVASDGSRRTAGRARTGDNDVIFHCFAFKLRPFRGSSSGRKTVWISLNRIAQVGIAIGNQR